MKGKLFLAVFLILYISSFAQKTSKQFVVGFYNVENLFDVIDDPNTNDDEFTPLGKRQWDLEKYQNKITNISKAILSMNLNQSSSPDFIGLCEIENIKCLNDLITSNLLKSSNYKIVHFDSPDKRGIDCAFLYKNSRFKLIYSKPYSVKLFGKQTSYSRDILLIKGELNKNNIYFIINHWPSKIGGEEKTDAKRIQAASICRSILISIFKEEPKAKIIIMGDFNDNPDDVDVSKVLNIKHGISELVENGFYNPAYSLFINGQGTLKYKGKWNLFDQIMVSKALVGESKIRFNSFYIDKASFLFNKKQNNLLRTYDGKIYKNGYSDHLPVFAIFDINK